MTSRGSTGAPDLGRLRPRYLLAGVALAGLLAISSGGGAGVLRTSAARDVAPTASHAQVIAQAVVDLDAGDHLWTVTGVDVEAGGEPAVLGTADGPGFVLGAEGQTVVRDSNGHRTRLAGGEALAVRPDGVLTVQAAGADEASVLLLSLEESTPNDLSGSPLATDVFASPVPARSSSPAMSSPRARPRRWPAATRPRSCS